MKTLDPFNLPLNQSCLIEASAGTGKTYTMVNLYLRLLLGVGCTPLTVEQILVVTFTKAATQELRDRIRQKVAEVSKLFRTYHTGESEELKQDPFLFNLYQSIEPRLSEALLRLRIAEREIDLAAIFTIDSFCQKMLFQFAFDSGIRFDIDLQANERDLLTRLSQETWRELFYPLSLSQTAMVAEILKTPQNVLDKVKSHLSRSLDTLSDEHTWITQDFIAYSEKLEQFIQSVKAHWQQYGEEIVGLIRAEINKAYKKGEKKALSRRSYQERWLESWENELAQWAESSALSFPANFERFCQDFIESKAEPDAHPLQNPHFAKNQAFLTAYQQQYEGKLPAVLQFHFLKHLQRKLSDYKQTHKTKSFDDILHFLHKALHSERGGELAKQIRQLFPFAMIDEFQDTNQVQYEIFSQIFMAEGVEDQGFIMIGDPKQSIYQFRGADIFTYLKASQEVNTKATLDRNWRSLPKLVEGVNRLFQFPEKRKKTALNNDNLANKIKKSASEIGLSSEQTEKLLSEVEANFDKSAEYPIVKKSPFIYQDITFQAVKSNDAGDALIDSNNDEIQATRYFLNDELSLIQAAELCAYQIQKQLKSASTGQYLLRKNGEIRPLAAQDITILVRSHNQASLIREKLLERHIQSVFLAEKNSVFESQEAKDLLLILKACLNPFHQRNLLSALGTFLWGLTANELYQLKQDESKWDNYVEVFVHYQHIWQQQGILPMLHQIFLQQGIIQRINAMQNADRRITDILHLAELLQNASASLDNDHALLRWFEQQIQDPQGDSEEQTLRLESEENLVKIVTIHGSKGLEYPVVWLPFAYRPCKEPSSTGISYYRNAQGKADWHFGIATDEVKEALTDAEFSEALRLLYVAMTRAKYQLNVLLPSQFEKGWNPLHYLLSNGGKDLAPTKELLENKDIPCEIIENAEVEVDDWVAKPDIQPELTAHTFLGKIQSKGQVTSFTALQAQNERLQISGKIAPLAAPSSWLDDGLDYDSATAGNFIVEVGIEDDEEPQKFTPYLFPHSAKVGNLIHQLFEDQDFSQAFEQEKIAQLCEQLGLSEEWIAPTQYWFDSVLSTPFGEHPFALKEVNQAKCLKEWQFYLRLSNAEALPKLNKLLREHSPIAKDLPSLQLFELEGYVRGFIDCIVEVNQRFYVIDYKSNYLGNQPEDYTQERLAKTIGQFRYDLQYLLYTLALHRYLGSRLGENYDYERDFGGVAYLFLRGMKGEHNSGVFFDKPSFALIDGLDKLFK